MPGAESAAPRSMRAPPATRGSETGDDSGSDDAMPGASSASLSDDANIGGWMRTLCERASSSDALLPHAWAAGPAADT